MVETISSLPVVFFDGETETNIGNVIVSRGMDYKSLISVLSKRIGISARHFSVYLSDPGASAFSFRNAPLTSKSNFAAISREKGSVFLVVLKRSRWVKRPEPSRKDPSPGNYTILKRSGQGTNGVAEPTRMSFPGLEYGYYPAEELERRMSNLRVEKDRFLMNMGRVEPNPNPVTMLDGKDQVRGRSRESNSDVACEECVRGNLEFHPCVNDPVVLGFRSSPEGPITRPGKRSEGTCGGFYVFG